MFAFGEGVLGFGFGLELGYERGLRFRLGFGVAAGFGEGDGEGADGVKGCGGWFGFGGGVVVVVVGLVEWSAVDLGVKLSLVGVARVAVAFRRLWLPAPVPL